MPSLAYLEACCNDPSSAGSTMGFIPDSIKKITLALTSFCFSGETSKGGVIINSIRSLAAVGPRGQGFLWKGIPWWWRDFLHKSTLSDASHLSLDSFLCSVINGENASTRDISVQNWVVSWDLSALTQNSCQFTKVMAWDGGLVLLPDTAALPAEMAEWTVCLPKPWHFRAWFIDLDD